MNELTKQQKNGGRIMIIYASEETILELAEKTNRISVLTLDATKNYKQLSAGMEVSITQVNILPAPDTLHGISNGDVKVKKVIEKVLKELKKPEKIKNSTRPVDLYIFASMVMDNISKGRITAVVAPDAGNDDRLNSFCEKYFVSVMKLFGLKVSTPDTSKKDRKILKAVMKGKGKKVKAKIRDYVASGISDKGADVYQRIRKAYALEIISDSFESSMRNGTFVLKKMNIKRGVRQLTKALTGKNKRDDLHRKYYKELREIGIFKMPSLKAIKKMAKKDKDIKIKKVFLPIIIRHVALRSVGISLGSKAYFTDMMPIVKGTVASADDEKNFRESVKAYVEATEKSGK